MFFYALSLFLLFFKLARLFAIDFFDNELREKIIKLIDDDRDELDSNQDYV